MSETLLEVKNLSMHFPIMGGVFRRPVGKVHAVNDVSFELHAGETFGVVGESGCGKSTLGRTIVRLYEPTQGSVNFRGDDIAHLKGDGLMRLRREIQMIFQDPYASLNPRMTIRDILEEPFILHGMGGSAEERLAKVKELVKVVGLRVSDINKFPHEFSGGQRQRIGIARALTLNPSIIVCDEAVSALDVSIQSQVLNLLIELQKTLNLTYVFISHDLTVVKYISDRVAVMYLGRIVELASSDDIYDNAMHPYTKALLSSVPVPDPDRIQHSEILEGEVPSPTNPPSGCPFHTRCKYVTDRCINELPRLTKVAGNDDHQVACHFAEKIKEEADQG
ncbi:ABC transporter ATP-binding protein [Pseudobacteriovorax antillogorgiicola]|uniref:Peptide/nickel transport system ATP-binding protein/oligopeptide transport system ATP-binding protein n=1 Tax=Pseudobacteriovorax antillogorgiicola TaxID=1513793 RepID=A0A1Y6CKB4_9BACT|nr:oligopeptide/dipeptide ABC transporter ATP-binding protein [Pseudobacteriovorax antillogorgiicola]TCS45628.1 peptide/nickel transport system ATP-binding protein/oligopeptide transport system ATP-binding protein [Pseudobacteriovorax antillogorgiicola]SMF72498.1 peptide/nickel transport system ATP-binding protein/oligopeptide transport system ATP-binding protein [Pseudobacteriovorax antillogorgiicola]